MTDDPSHRLFIHHAAQLLNPRLGEVSVVPRLSLSILCDAAVLIEGARILAVGPTESLCQDPRVHQATHLDASGCIVSPAFVDAHTHPVFAATREEEYEMRIRGASYESIAAAGGGIRNSVRRLRAATEDSLFDQALARCRQFLAYGTTTIEAKSGYGLDLENELKILRVIDRLRHAMSNELEILPTFLGAHEFPDEFRGRRNDYVDLLCDVMIPRVAEEKLALFCDVFCESSVFSVEESKRLLLVASRHGLYPRIHSDQLTHSGGTRLAVELKALSADHLEQIDDADIALLADSNVVAILLPGASFHLGRNLFAPARRLIDAGATVALATDFNPGTSPSLNMQTILSIACSSLRMTPAEAFAGATLGGARALGREDQIGSLDPGKQADIVLFKVPDFRLVPYHYGMNSVRSVIKKGVVLFDHGKT